MKKNRVALILVLFVVCSYPVFSDQENCIPTQEYYLGLIDGRTHSPWGWGWLGLGLTAMGGIVQRIASYQSGYYFASEYYLLIGPGIGTAISIVLPLAIKPQPKVIPANISEDQLNCYLDGYKRTARPKNVTRVLIGCAAGWGYSLILLMMLGY